MFYNPQLFSTRDRQLTRCCSTSTCIDGTRNPEVTSIFTGNHYGRLSRLTASTINRPHPILQQLERFRCATSCVLAESYACSSSVGVLRATGTGDFGRHDHFVKLGRGKPCFRPDKSRAGLRCFLLRLEEESQSSRCS